MGLPQVAVTKPSRSDEVLDADRQLQIANEVRAHFDAVAPKRPSKPNRSEPEPEPEPDPTSKVASSTQDEDFPVPELEKLRSLQSQSQTVMLSGTGTMMHEEFVETQYYKQLDSVDKQHHTTGNGFIKVASTEKTENAYDLRLQGGGQENYNGRSREFKTNPATNDWIPSVEDYQMEYVSSKPNRSESS